MRLRRYVSGVFAIGVLVSFLAFLCADGDRYRRLLHLSSGMVAVLCSLVFFNIVTNGLSNHVLYKSLGLDVQLSEAIELAAVNSLANHLPFSAGIIAKGVYLKQRYELAYDRFISATLALYVVFLTTTGLTGVLVLLGRQLLSHNPIPLWLLLGFALTATSFLALRLPLERLPVPTSWRTRVDRIADGWCTVTSRKWLAPKLMVLYIVMMLTTGGRYWLAFRALSQDVSFSVCVLFAAGSVLTQMVSVVPGGLGVREGIVAAMAAVMGFGAAVSAVAVALDRLIATLVIVLVGSVSIYLLSQRALPEQTSLEEL